MANDTFIDTVTGSSYTITAADYSAIAALVETDTGTDTDTASDSEIVATVSALNDAKPVAEMQTVAWGSTIALAGDRIESYDSETLMDGFEITDDAFTAFVTGLNDIDPDYMIDSIVSNYQTPMAYRWTLCFLLDMSQYCSEVEMYLVSTVTVINTTTVSDSNDTNVNNNNTVTIQEPELADIQSELAAKPMKRKPFGTVGSEHAAAILNDPNRYTGWLLFSGISDQTSADVRKALFGDTTTFEEKLTEIAAKYGMDAAPQLHDDPVFGGILDMSVMDLYHKVADYIGDIPGNIKDVYTNLSDDFKNNENAMRMFNYLAESYEDFKTNVEDFHPVKAFQDWFDKHIKTNWFYQTYRFGAAPHEMGWIRVDRSVKWDTPENVRWSNLKEIEAEIPVEFGAVPEDKFEVEEDEEYENLVAGIASVADQGDVVKPKLYRDREMVTISKIADMVDDAQLLEIKRRNTVQEALNGLHDIDTELRQSRRVEKITDLIGRYIVEMDLYADRLNEKTRSDIILSHIVNHPVNDIVHAENMVEVFQAILEFSIGVRRGTIAFASQEISSCMCANKASRARRKYEAQIKREMAEYKKAQALRKKRFDREQAKKAFLYE
ncbi:hypothetical protein KIPB_004508 [Kipferlia bialata]|uniref:Uncharacterized protein n=1 Tax=Kipferlia bialata TaxID=797122 RepID=A0A9K3CU52_9EUKA|nr:hypothetical protein KIPB_004508 [Kipferlia bialata]|eukprot:g4508.t1